MRKKNSNGTGRQFLVKRIAALLGGSPDRFLLCQHLLCGREKEGCRSYGACGLGGSFMKQRTDRSRRIMITAAVALTMAFLLVSPLRKTYAMTVLSSPKFYNLTFTDMNGKKRDIRKMKTKSTILLFGRSGCSRSRSMLATASRLKKNGAKTTVVFLGVDSYDSGLYSLKREYTNVIFVGASTVNNSTMWSMLRRCGCNYSSISLPAAFILNKYGLIKYYSTGTDYALSSNLKYGNMTERIRLSRNNLEVYFTGSGVHNGCVLYKNGKARKPLPTVYLNGSNGYGYLVKGKDFTVTYKNNKRIGTAKATIRGKGAFKGKLTVKFRICGTKLKKNRKITVDKTRYTVIKGGKSGKIRLKLTAGSKTDTYAACPQEVYYQAKKCKVTKIGKNAFRNYTQVHSAAVGSNVTQIEAGAYQGCTGLKYLYVYAKHISKIGANAFSQVPEGVIVYVSGSDGYRQKVEKMMKAAGLSGGEFRANYDYN